MTLAGSGSANIILYAFLISNHSLPGRLWALLQLYCVMFGIADRSMVVSGQPPQSCSQGGKELPIYSMVSPSWSLVEADLIPFTFTDRLFLPLRFPARYTSFSSRATCAVAIAVKYTIETSPTGTTDFCRTYSSRLPTVSNTS